MSKRPKKRIIFEGWRFIPHSAAIVLQSYCLSAIRRPDIEVLIRELPFNGPWSRIGGMFPEALDRALHTIPVAEAHEPADVVVRIGSPVDLAPARLDLVQGAVALLLDQGPLGLVALTRLGHLLVLHHHGRHLHRAEISAAAKLR